LRIENPRVRGSIPRLATKFSKSPTHKVGLFAFWHSKWYFRIQYRHPAHRVGGVIYAGAACVRPDVPAWRYMS